MPRPFFYVKRIPLSVATFQNQFYVVFLPRCGIIIEDL
jgi:hypothetical protein